MLPQFFFCIFFCVSVEGNPLKMLVFPSKSEKKSFLYVAGRDRLLAIKSRKIFGECQVLLAFAVVSGFTCYLVPLQHTARIIYDSNNSIILSSGFCEKKSEKEQQLVNYVTANSV